MPYVFRLISEYFWLIMLGFSVFNYMKAKRELPTRHPEAQPAPKEAEAYLLRFAVAAAAPWVAMGVGQLSGATPSVWYYFRPQDGNPFVIAWLGAIFLLSAVYAWWALLAGGARKVREFNLMAAVGQRSSTQSELVIKLLAVAGVLVVPLWIAGVVLMNTKIPN